LQHIGEGKKRKTADARAKRVRARRLLLHPLLGVWRRITAKAKKLGRKDGKASVGLSAIPYFFVLSCACTSIHVVSVPVVSAGAAVWAAWGITWSTAAENTDLNGA
jgi:hypothetical protein